MDEIEHARWLAAHPTTFTEAMVFIVGWLTVFVWANWFSKDKPKT